MRVCAGLGLGEKEMDHSCTYPKKSYSDLNRLPVYYIDIENPLVTTNLNSFRSDWFMIARLPSSSPSPSDPGAGADLMNFQFEVCIIATIDET